MAKEKRATGRPACDAHYKTSTDLETADPTARSQAKPAFFDADICEVLELLAAPGSSVMGYGGPDHQTSDGFWSVEDHAQASQGSAAWAVVPAPWLDAIDADAPFEVDSLRLWMAAVGAIDGAWVIEVASGSSGRRHAWAYIPSRDDRATAWDLAETLRLHRRHGAGGRMRPIYSPHRSGHGFAQPIGRTRAEVVELLRAARDAEAPKYGSTGAQGASRPKSKARNCLVSDDLAHAHTKGPPKLGAVPADVDGSAEVYRAIRDGMALGRSAEDVLEAIMRGGTGAGRRWLEKDSRKEKPRAKFYRTWRRLASTATEPAIRSRGDALRLLDRQRRAAASLLDRWRGIGGRTDQVVYETLHDIARKLGSVAVEVSVREIALAARISRGAASNSLHRLAQAEGVAPFITIARRWHRREDGSNAPTTWRINRIDDSEACRVAMQSKEVGQPDAPHHLVAVQGTRTPTLAAQAEVWRWRALGKTARAIYLFCFNAGSPVSVAQVVEAVGCHRTTAVRCLRRMAGSAPDRFSRRAQRHRATLVSMVGDHWKVETEDLAGRFNRVASVYGVDGRTAEQREVFQFEREEWSKDFLERRPLKVSMKRDKGADAKTLARLAIASGAYDQGWSAQAS